MQREKLTRRCSSRINGIRMATARPQILNQLAVIGQMVPQGRFARLTMQAVRPNALDQITQARDQHVLFDPADPALAVTQMHRLRHLLDEQTLRLQL